MFVTPHVIESWDDRPLELVRGSAVVVDEAFRDVCQGLIHGARGRLIFPSIRIRSRVRAGTLDVSVLGEVASC